MAGKKRDKVKERDLQGFKDFRVLADMLETLHTCTRSLGMDTTTFGCQTITWGDNQWQDFPRVFEEIAAAGFAGVEIGYRRLQQTQPQDLLRMLDTRHLTLLGAHIGGNLEDADQAAGERNLLEKVLDYLDACKTTRLMYSGLQYKNQTQFHQDLAMLRRASRHCRDRGVTLLYHNHNWEFADGGRVIEALLGETDISFCPDIGWMMKGGADPVTLLDRMGSRVGAVHFKDFASAEKGLVDTVLLGKGVAPLAQAAQWGIRKRPDVWMIAEQDQSDQPTAEVARRNGDYLRRIFEPTELK